MSLLAQHSSATCEHGSPPHIIAFGRAVLGHIDCDPFSSEHFNAAVGATLIHTAETDALRPGRRWVSTFGDPGFQTFFINPPSGLVKEAWRFATERWLEGSAVFWVGFSLEQFLYLQRLGLLYRGFHRCIPPSRLNFTRVVEASRQRPLFDATSDEPVALDEADSPTHGNYLCLLPSAHEQVERFRELARALPAEVF